MKKINRIQIEKLIDSIIKENSEIPTSGKLSNNLFDKKVGKLEVIERDRFNEWATRVWDMLVLSYEDKGGIQSYRHYDDFCAKHPLLIIVLNSNGELMACASYRNTGRDDFKMTAGGCIQNDEGKAALQQIIKHNIDNFHLHYWAEVSGPFEHWFKKYNGYPMPNMFASEILRIPSERIELSKNDAVHYERIIGQGGVYKKMIFGCPSEEIFAEVVKNVINYMDFRKLINSEDIRESKFNNQIDKATYIIENIYRAHEEDGFNELIPDWYEALHYALNILYNSQEKTTTVTTYIEYGEYLLRDMQLLELHPLIF